MYGPWALTHVVYVLLVIGFVAAEGYMVIYNLRMKRREKAMKAAGHQLGKSEGIAAAAEARHLEYLQKH